MTILEEALGLVREKSFNLQNTPIPNRIFSPGGEDLQDILLFPRKKVRVDRNFFIQERLKERATSLNQPTEDSCEALSSGLRSGIIRTKSGAYFKLKGIGINPNLRYHKIMRGACSVSEAYREQCYSNILSEHLHLPMRPRFIKLIKHDFKSCEEKGITSVKRDAKELRKELTNYFGTDLRRYCISAFEIAGDTRLDEAIYNLTKKEFSGSEKQVQARLLNYLSFHAGIQKGYLAELGFSWGNSLTSTNAHIGNFVVYSDHGLISVGMTDLSELKSLYEFGSICTERMPDFLQFMGSELKTFEDDFNNKATCGTTSFIVYRNFTRDLRISCFNSFETGYRLALLDSEKHNEISYWDTKEPRGAIVPEDVWITEEEFKEECKKLTK